MYIYIGLKGNTWKITLCFRNGVDICTVYEYLYVSFMLQYIYSQYIHDTSIYVKEIIYIHI